MQNTMFRKKCIDKISSPEELNEYIKVSNPSVWIMLLAIMVFLGSVTVWGFSGELRTTQKIKGVVQDGTMICYLPDITGITDEMVIEVKGDSYEIFTIKDEPLSKNEIDSFYEKDNISYALDVDERSYALVVVNVSMNDGIYDAKLVKESIHPIQFLFN